MSANNIFRHVASLVAEEHSSSTEPRASAVFRVCQPLLKGCTERTRCSASTTCGQRGIDSNCVAGLCKAVATSCGAPDILPAAASAAKVAAETTPFSCIQPIHSGENMTSSCGL